MKCLRLLFTIIITSFPQQDESNPGQTFGGTSSRLPGLPQRNCKRYVQVLEISGYFIELAGDQSDHNISMERYMRLTGNGRLYTHTYLYVSRKNQRVDRSAEKMMNVTYADYGIKKSRERATNGHVVNSGVETTSLVMRPRNATVPTPGLL